METKKDILNRLFVENNLTDEDVFKHKFYNRIAILLQWQRKEQCQEPV
jgi:hypothetical protein